MKTPIAAILTVLLLLPRAEAQRPASLQPAPPAVQGPYLRVFVVEPPHRLDWSSPRALLKTTLRNGLSGDYAPNGHVAVYLKTRQPNRYGVTEILTGMGRTNKLKTLWETIYREYGLSAMVHEFSGDLDSSTTTEEELRKAARAHRLSSLEIQLTDEKAARMMAFLENWIEYGSYRHYGGNYNVARGEGSGCADFGAHFIRLALDGRLPADNWVRRVYLPYSLLQEAPGRPERKVPVLKILNSSLPWATSDRDGLLFSIPDPEIMAAWIKKRDPRHWRAMIVPENLPVTEKFEPESAIPEFNAPYTRESPVTIQAKWKSIRVSN